MKSNARYTKRSPLGSRPRRNPNKMRATGATSIATTRSFVRFVVRRTIWRPTIAKAANPKRAGRIRKKAGGVRIVPTKRTMVEFVMSKKNPSTGGRKILEAGRTRPFPIRRFAGLAKGEIRAVRSTTTATNKVRACGARTSARNGRSTEA
ncbi:MAG: hypothetical protein E6J94_08820 [Methanobacteriota archaeon]|nr:MAG: hypothetical protein E6J94_08820 [Euryarchaeota archaeon]